MRASNCNLSGHYSCTGVLRVGGNGKQNTCIYYRKNALQSNRPIDREIMCKTSFEPFDDGKLQHSFTTTWNEFLVISTRLECFGANRKSLVPEN